MAEKQTCNNEGIIELLPWYLTNSLSASENSMVEKHLESCASCKQELGKMKWISEGFQSTEAIKGTKHINSVLLTIYSENKKELNKNTVERIEDHLSVCDSCTKELEILKNISYSSKRNAEISFFGALGRFAESFFSGKIIKPVFAYAMVLLLLYPAWLGIFKRSGNEKGIVKPISIEKSFVLQPADQRSVTEHTNIIQLQKSSELFTLSFNIPVSGEGEFTYDAHIVNDSNEKVWHEENIKPIDLYGSMIILCNQKFFSEGIYTLYLNEKNKNKSKILNVYKYAFKIQMNE